MATYTITLNERTASGKALMDYLKALGVLLHKISPKTKSSYLRSKEDIKAGRVETFSSPEEMFESLGIGSMYQVKMTKTFRKDTDALVADIQRKPKKPFPPVGDFVFVAMPVGFSL